MKMIECRECGAAHYPGTLFCRECGAFLGQAQGMRAPAEMTTAVSQHIEFLIPHSGRRLSMNLDTPIWIGRADPDEGFWPRLDLTYDNGVELGVSRRHALIKRGAEGIVLIDQNSANGTWLNGKQLEGERPYLLPRHSEAKFGNLLMHIFLE